MTKSENWLLYEKIGFIKSFASILKSCHPYLLRLFFTLYLSGTQAKIRGTVAGKLLGFFALVSQPLTKLLEYKLSCFVSLYWQALAEAQKGKEHALVDSVSTIFAVRWKLWYPPLG